MKSTVVLASLLIGWIALVSLVLTSLLDSDRDADIPGGTVSLTTSTVAAATAIVLEPVRSLDYSFAPLRTDHGAVPLRPRADPAMVVLEDGRVVIWGGRFEALNLGFPTLEDAYFNDGAVYDPSSRSWEMMSDTDLPAASLNSPFGLAVDDRVYWFSDRHTASWDPVSNTWESLASAPRPVAHAVWDGSRIISLSAHAMYDPREDEWVPLAASLATIADLDAKLIHLGGELIAAVGIRDAVSLHRLTAEDQWELVSRFELRGSVYGFDISVHESTAYLVTARGMTIRYNFDTDVWSPHQRLPLPTIPQLFQVKSTSIGPIWFGGGTAIRLNDPSLLPVPDPAGRFWRVGGGAGVWGIAQEGMTLKLFHFDASEIPSQQIVGFGLFTLDVSDLEVSIEQEPLSTILPNQSVVKFNLVFSKGSCEISIFERLVDIDQDPTPTLTASLTCPDERLVRQAQSRVGRYGTDWAHSRARHPRE